MDQLQPIDPAYLLSSHRNDFNMREPEDIYATSSDSDSQEEFYRYTSVPVPSNSALLQKPLTSSAFGDSGVFSEGQHSIISDRTSTRRSGHSRFHLGWMWFFITALASAILVTALEAFMFGLINIHRDNFYSQNRYLEMSIFLALFIFAGFYQIAIMVMALRWRNMLLLASLCVFYACMLIYTGIQYHEISSNIDLVAVNPWQRAAKATNIAAICVLALTLVIQTCIVFFLLRKSLKWFNFKKTGASFEIKRLYSVFQLHRCLLVFDFFFFLGFTVQFIVIMISDKTSIEFILTCCILPLTVLVLIASDIGVCRELISLSIGTILLFTAGCVYVLFKMIRLFTKYTSAYDVAVVPGHYFPGRTSLMCFGCITLVVLFATIIIEGIAIHGYDHGLLPFLSSNYSFLSRNPKHGQFEEKDDYESQLID